jgi:hypothetical protein
LIEQLIGAVAMELHSFEQLSLPNVLESVSPRSLAA